MKCYTFSRIFGPKNATSPTVATLSWKRASERKTYWLMMGTKKGPEPEEIAFLNQLLSTNPEVRAAQELAKGFYEIVSQRKGAFLDEWIEQVKRSNLPELKSFVRGLKMDEPAVRAALEHE